MIIIKIAGGLGNQMQQYSVYRKLLMMGKEVKLDLSWFDPKIQEKMLAPREFELSHFKDLPYEVCTDEERDFFLKQSILKKAVGKALKRLGIKESANERVFTESKMYHPEIFDLDDKYIEGYFACQKYYDDIMDELRDLFIFPTHPDTEINLRNMDLMNEMELRPSVSVHIRRGDYLDPENAALFGNIATDAY